MWGLVAGTIAWAAFPQQKGAILAASAAIAVVRNIRSRRSREDAHTEDAEVAEEALQGVTLEWQAVSVKLLDKKGHEAKRILQNVSGKAKPGRLLAIMGPSGSGKTTLLNALAGQMPKSKKVQLTGRLLINGKDGRNAQRNHKLAYVRQEDIFYSQLTVRETLRMAAKLQMARSIPEAEKEAYVEELIQKLGLVACASTIVGDEKTRGISGGEKKRLSIAVELIASPAVIFADEPTTGLDAFQAERVMEALKKLAAAGHTVVATIHQPRGSIFQKFDDLLLLAEGQIVYDGVAAGAMDYFAKQGHKVPEHHNPAEYFADLISLDYSSPDLEAASRDRVRALVRSFQQHPRRDTADSEARAPGSDAKGAIKRHLPPSSNDRSSWGQQFQLLLSRAWRQITRDKSTNLVRGAMNVTSAIIFGCIYWRMGLAQSAIQDRMGLLQVVAINTAMSSLTKTVNVFPREKDIVQRERTKGQYNVAPYFVSKLAAELPVTALFPLAFGCILYPMAGMHKSLSRFVRFLGIVTLESFTSAALGLAVGAVAPTPEAALALGPMVMLFFIIFGGYYVNPDNAPRAFRWIPKASLIKWGFEAFCVNELQGLRFKTATPADTASGEQVLKRLTFGDSTVKVAAAKEARILAFLYLLTFSILRDNKPQFQPMEDPLEMESLTENGVENAAKYYLN